MDQDSKPRPGTMQITYGVLCIFLAVVYLAKYWIPGPNLLLSYVGLAILGLSMVFGAAMILRGWTVLQRMKAACPQLTWWQYIGGDVIGVGMVAALIAVLCAMSAHQRDRFAHWLKDLYELLFQVRGPR